MTEKRFEYGEGTKGPLIYKDTNDEKICRNCLHYSFGECDIYEEYTGEEWFCDLWE